MTHRPHTIANNTALPEAPDSMLAEVLALREEVQRTAAVLRQCRAALRTVEEQLGQCEARLDQTLLAVELVRRTVCPDTRRRDSGEPTELSVRELEVLRLVAQGLGNREIAEQLVAAEGTIKNHLRVIYRKLGANGRLHAVIVARQAGLLLR